MLSVHNVPRSGTYRARRAKWSLAYRVGASPHIECRIAAHIDIKLIAGTINQYAHLARVGALPGAAGTGALVEWPSGHISSLPKANIST